MTQAVAIAATVVVFAIALWAGSAFASRRRNPGDEWSSDLRRISKRYRRISDG